MSRYSCCRIRTLAMGRRHRSRGFTLIELMVAMLLGLIVIAGVASVFLANLRSYHTNEALGDVQSNARIAFELMARDIRQAGLTGCVSNGGHVANVLGNGPNNGGVEWWANWDNAVHGYGAGDTDPAVSDADRVDGTDSLQLIGATGSGASIASTNATDASFKINEPSTGLQTGDIVMVCDPDHATIVQITKYTAGTNPTVEHATKENGDVSPGNCSTGLDYPTACSPLGNYENAFVPNSRVSELNAVDWYIGTNPGGGKSLYRKALVLQDKVMAPEAQEMVRNVTDMQILYLQSGTSKFVSAAGITDWSKVSAVRVTLRMESTDPRAGTDAKPLTRTFTSTTTIRNRVS